jgi:hypothetical protein
VNSVAIYGRNLIVDAIKRLTSDQNANRRLKGTRRIVMKSERKSDLMKKKIEISGSGAGPKWVNDDGR